MWEHVPRWGTEQGTRGHPLCKGNSTLEWPGEGPGTSEPLGLETGEGLVGGLGPSLPHPGAKVAQGAQAKWGEPSQDLSHLGGAGFPTTNTVPQGRALATSPGAVPEPPPSGGLDPPWPGKKEEKTPRGG